VTGLPHHFASRAAYDDLIASLVAVGAIEDASKIDWDVRRSTHVETREFRDADVCLTIDEAVMIAGLCRALARTCTRSTSGASRCTLRAPSCSVPPSSGPRGSAWTAN
jgi:gamma-glutamyl:cysteine ligase YbdK (ATP-grasp superfamily)